MGVCDGLAVSAHGTIARKGSDRSNGNSKREWGIQFDLGAVETFERYCVFDEFSSAHLGSTAVLISDHPLELVWWFVRLLDNVHTVLIGTDDELVVRRLEKMNRSKKVARLKRKAPRSESLESVMGWGEADVLGNAALGAAGHAI
jgi:hypothetical protein